MSNLAIDWLDRNKSLCKRRDANFDVWQALADILHPTRGGFTKEFQEGQEVNTGLYDSTPMQARRGLAAAIGGLVRPSEAGGLNMKSEDEKLNEIDVVKRWFATVTDRMWAAIYSPAARYIQQSSAVDNDLATFGLGYLWTEENRRKSGLSFRAIHLARIAFDENSDGLVDTVAVTKHLTARQAAQKWGEEALGKKVLEALRSTKPSAKDQPFTFIQCVYPNEERDTRRRDNKNMPFHSLIIGEADEKIISESGYMEFPVAIPRWETAPDQIYPRSPGMVALPDSRTLQAMGHTILVAGQKAADPAMWGVDDGVLSALRTYPGGFTTVSADAIRDTGGHPLGVLDTGKNLPIGREMQADYRAMVEAAFFKNVFNLPIDVKNMTATEIIARKEEFVRTIGPTLAQLEPDYTGSVMNRVFGIMNRAGVFPPPPQELENANVRFEFVSPIQRAKRQIEAAGMRGAIDFIAPIIQMQPETADNFDGDEIARDIPEAFGLREKWLKSIDRRDAERQAKQQQQQMVNAVAGAGGVADATQKFAGANKSLAEAAAMASPQQAIAGVQAAQQ